MIVATVVELMKRRILNPRLVWVSYPYCITRSYGLLGRVVKSLEESTLDNWRKLQ